MATITETASAAAPARRKPPLRIPGGSLWLLMPALIFFLIFFLSPVLSLFGIAFNKTVPGVVALQDSFDLSNFERFFNRALYYEAALRSIALAAITAAVALFLGYPLAYLIAKTRNPVRNTVLMILVLSAMQLDMVIRLYGLMVLLGDNGLVNGSLIRGGVIENPLPLMYNGFGVVLGLVQFTLPFMVLSLVGIIQGINPSLEEAARSLGASRWQAFWKITIPLSMPGILAGSVLVFALAISSYVVPALMGGWKVLVMPIHIYQQIAELGRWQFGAAIAVVLFATCLLALFVYQRLAARIAGGQA
jgi:putative spermidine/putrescine transport system permease protein